MLYKKLGKLANVELREAWNHEAKDFTNWLSEDENLSLLSDEIGIDIKLIQTEAKVGSFNVDILAEEENTGHRIIIENQLEPTDHDHLGKLITYASGHDAKYIIWIVKDVRDEHRQAIDWLNEHTDAGVNFFAIRIELWQIENSPFAPKFHVVSQPNDWAKAIRVSGGQGELSETRLIQLEFWNKFIEYASAHKANIKLRKPLPQQWYEMSYGVSGSRVSLTINTNTNLLGCEIYIPDSKELFHSIHENKDKIEHELGEKLEWMELPNKKASRIKITRDGDMYDKNKWKEYLEWFLAETLKFQNVFSKYGKK
jgi:hypothetical protein